MKLFNDLNNIVRYIESVFDIQLTDENFIDGRDEIMHIFLHEACHAAISASIPWIHDLDEKQHTIVDEILARLIEGEVAPSIGIAVHTPEEHVKELSFYPVKITVRQYEHLCEKWEKQYWSNKDLTGMASYILNYLIR